MYIDALQEINSRVDILDVAGYLGLTVNRAGFISCPLHSERTASCKLYREQGQFYCFGCNRGGDAIDLVVAVRGVSISEAAAELNSYYNLGIDLDGKQGKRIRRKPRSLQVNEAEQVERLVDAFADTAREARKKSLDVSWFDEVHQAMLEDDNLRRSAPEYFMRKWKGEFDRYADIRNKYQRICDAISRSDDYPAEEILAIMGRTRTVSG